MKSVKRALERHYKRHHPDTELPFCVNKQVTVARVVEALVSERKIKSDSSVWTDESYETEISDSNTSESSDDSPPEEAYSESSSSE